jgi:hypothetical protein
LISFTGQQSAPGGLDFANKIKVKIQKHATAIRNCCLLIIHRLLGFCADAGN